MTIYGLGGCVSVSSRSVRLARSSPLVVLHTLPVDQISAAALILLNQSVDD